MIIWVDMVSIKIERFKTEGVGWVSNFKTVFLLKEATVKIGG